MLNRYRKEALDPSTQGSATSRNLDAVEELSRSLERTRFLDGELIAGIVYSGTPVTVLHGLQRKWVGYLVTKLNATEVVAALDVNNPEADKAAQITLSASGNVTFDLCVF